MISRNAQGIEVNNGEVKDGSIGIKSLGSGMYMFQLREQKGTHSIKFIKK
jgi:hypothetical protein